MLAQNVAISQVFSATISSNAGSPYRITPKRGGRLRRIFVLFAAIAALLAGWSTMDARAAESSVVAVVNADPISRDALAQASLERYGSDVLDNLSIVT